MQWTLEEDQILQFIMQNPPLRDDNTINWSLIATNLSGRNSKQCREHWTNVLNPFINKKKWNKEEDILLNYLVNTYGRQWKIVALYMNGRNANDIKNRWNGQMNRRNIRKDISVILDWPDYEIYNMFAE